MRRWIGSSVTIIKEYFTTKGYRKKTIYKNIDKAFGKSVFGNEDVCL